MDRKAQLKAGLAFGVGMAVFYTLQNLLKRDISEAREVMMAVVMGLISGAISGFLFGWILGLFTNSKYVKRTTRIDLNPGEAILFETGANHYKGAEAVGGKLYLTNERLVFKSHKLNFQNHELSIGLARIEDVTRFKNIGIVNNGLTVITADKENERFVVQQSAEWLKRLTGVKK